MMKIDKDIDLQRTRISKKAIVDMISPEEKALKEFKLRLGKKGLTPEAFFRICDTTYQQTITVDQFKTALKTHKIWLSRGQNKRMELIMDEDMEGHITL